MGKKQVLRHRLVLGLLLLTGAALFMWAQSFLSDTTYADQTLLPGSGYGLPAAHLRPYDPYNPGVAPPPYFPLVGLEDIIFTPPVPIPERREPTRPAISEEYMQRLMSFDYLVNNIFLVDRYTTLFPSDIDTGAFLQADLTIDTTVAGPQVLIFHTHSQERFIDSNPLDPMDGVVGVGRVLAEILEETYGISVLHSTHQFDVVDGRPRRQGAYERMEPVIRQVLEDNPSIQMVIDIHRDGVRENAGPFITYINNQRTARIMFFNGLSRQNRGGQVTAVPWLPNPYLRDNLNLSFQLQLAANQLYPGFARRVYLREFRYSLHMMPMSMFVEVGNQYNTFAEAVRAMEPMASIIAAVILCGPPEILR
ncbi:MAG: stage II sporulation protein P [Defluviitaleaceae bacterium]|nr:stage II sporulation protein P [Defluviitaleaceae bacterium]